MKICIITLYRTINSGSYLQAFALKNYFDLIGHEAFILKFNYSFQSQIKDMLKYPKNFIFEKPNNFKIFVQTNRRFKELQKKLDIISYKKAIKNIDYFVFGSDTIWNIDSKNLYKLRNILFGIKFTNKKKIAYASSFANTQYEKVIKHKDIVNALKNYDCISVRDNDSFNIIKKICEKEPTLVCDPTLLVDKQLYSSLMFDIENNNYIYTYLFADLDSKTKKSLIKFAKERKLKIISGTKSYNWCEERVSNSPDSFLSYISKAKYVVTDTFHGTIFSTIFNKQFAVINRNKKKVNDYIKRVELNSILINKNEEINTVLSKKINYKIVNKLIIDYKEESYKYINDALK